MAIVELKNVSRVYTSGDHELKALDGVNLSLDEGKFVVILGPSGAGKSTLLNRSAGWTVRLRGRSPFAEMTFQLSPKTNSPITERRR